MTPMEEETEKLVESFYKKLLYGVFDGRIVPALKLFGLLDFGYEKARKEYIVNRGLGIEWFAITELGKKIFRGIR